MFWKKRPWLTLGAGLIGAGLYWHWSHPYPPAVRQRLRKALYLRYQPDVSVDEIDRTFEDAIQAALKSELASNTPAVIGIQVEYAKLLAQRGHRHRAAQVYDQAWQSAQTRLDSPKDVRYAASIAHASAETWQSVHRPREAEHRWTWAITTLIKAAQRQQDPADVLRSPEFIDHVGPCVEALAELQMQQHRMAEAYDSYIAAVNLMERRAGTPSTQPFREPFETHRPCRLATIMNNLAVVTLSRGYADQARQWHLLAERAFKEGMERRRFWRSDDANEMGVCEECKEALDRNRHMMIEKQRP